MQSALYSVLFMQKRLQIFFKYNIIIITGNTTAAVFVLWKGADELFRIRLEFSDESYEEVKKTLNEHGIETDDESEYVLLHKSIFPERIAVRDNEGTRLLISVEDIITIESYGHNIEVHTSESVYRSADSLARFESILAPDKFLRVSNSVIIRTDKIEHITPTLYMKFILKMKNSQYQMKKNLHFVFVENHRIL